MLRINNVAPSSVRATDLVSCLAGDEFTVILEDLNDTPEAALVARKIVDFATPIDLGTATWQVSTSIGVAFTRGAPVGTDNQSPDRYRLVSC
jgi:GGDEF domain-containing protein